MDKATREYMKRIGRKGGKRRAETLTPAQRQQIARLGGLAKGKGRRG